MIISSTKLRRLIYEAIDDFGEDREVIQSLFDEAVSRFFECGVSFSRANVDEEFIVASKQLITLLGWDSEMIRDMIADHESLDPYMQDSFFSVMKWVCFKSLNNIDDAADPNFLQLKEAIIELKKAIDKEDEDNEDFAPGDAEQDDNLYVIELQKILSLYQRNEKVKTLLNARIHGVADGFVATFINPGYNEFIIPSIVDIIKKFVRRSVKRTMI